MQVILASASPRRQELLKKIFQTFTVCPAQTKEQVPPDLPAEDCPAYLATEKAEAVATRYPEDLVIGCDTVVILNGQVLGKPKDEADAKAMLQALSGKTHTVVTGCALIWEGKTRVFSQTTQVTFHTLTEREIAAYVATKEPMDKAGAYGIQGQGGALVAKIEGDFYNVVGLPVARLQQEVEKLAIYSLLEYNFACME